MQGFIPWDIRVTLDLFLGGLGIGIFLISVLLSFYNKEQYTKLIKLSAYLAPVLFGVGLLLMVSELGRPARILTTLYRFNSQSVTSWGGYLQSIFLLLSLTYAVMHFKNIVSGTIYKSVQVSGVVFALAVGIYHGLLLSSFGRPLWVGSMIPVLFLLSSVLGGVAVVIIIKSISVSIATPKEVRAEVAAAENDYAKEVNFNLILFLLTGLQLVLLIIWQMSFYRSGLETLEAFNVMMTEYGMYWWVLVIITGLLIPFIYSIYELSRGNKTELSPNIALVLSLLIVIGSFTFKHIILIAGQINIPFF